LLQQLADHDLEFDQKLKAAFDLAASKPGVDPEDVGMPDSYITLALYRSNTILSRLVTLDETRLNIFHEYKKAPACSPRSVIAGERLCRVLNVAHELGGSADTIGVGHFLKAVVKLTLDTEAIDAETMGFPGQVLHNTFSSETLLWGLGHTAWTPVSKAPELRTIMEALDGRDPIEDHQYLLSVDRGRILFRPTSILDPYSMTDEGEKPVNRLALLPHFKDQYGGFIASEILEFEDLINNPKAAEADLQRFLEEHPHFLRLWDFRDVYPQVFLTHEGDDRLIPDFLLLDPILQKALIMDLKLPMQRIAVGRKNRRHFSAAITEARSQLLRYRDWFEQSSNREALKKRFGMNIYRPCLAVVIGRQADFTNEMERQTLSSQTPDLEVVTYDDVAEFAKRRLLLLERARRKDNT